MLFKCTASGKRGQDNTDMNELNGNIQLSDTEDRCDHNIYFLKIYNGPYLQGNNFSSYRKILRTMLVSFCQFNLGD